MNQALSSSAAAIPRVPPVRPEAEHVLPPLTGIAPVQPQRAGRGLNARRVGRVNAAPMRALERERRVGREVAGVHAFGHQAITESLAVVLPPCMTGHLAPVCRDELMGRFSDWVTDPGLVLSELQAFTSDPVRMGEPYLGRYLVWESSGTSGQPGIFVQDARAMAVYDALEAVRRSPDQRTRRWFDPFYLSERMAFVGATGGHFASFVSLERLRQLQPVLSARQTAHQCIALALKRVEAGAQGAQQAFDRGGQGIGVLGCDHIQTLRGGNQEQLNGAQMGGLAFVLRYQRQGLVDALHAFNVHSQGVQENTRQGMASDVGQRGVAGFTRILFGGLEHAACAHDQYFVSAQMDGG